MKARVGSALRAKPMRRGVVRRWPTVVLTALVATTVGTASPAWAASSGRVFQTDFVSPTASFEGCGEADMDVGAEAKSWATSFGWPEPYECDTSSLAPSPAGYLGVNAYEYINGAYCGSTGWYYDDTSNDNFGVGGAVCGNPAGSQNFYTVGYQEFYYSGIGYLGPYSVTSPSQTY